jgi:hypothetical protein
MLRIAIFPVVRLDQQDDVTAQGNGISAPYTNIPAIHFLKKDIFLHNDPQYAAQEFLIGLIAVKTFFMPHLKQHHENDVEWCIQAILHPCHARKEYITFGNSVF